jgi:hypothetical protein
MKQPLHPNVYWWRAQATSWGTLWAECVFRHPLDPESISRC